MWSENSRETVRRARQPHFCSECRDVIPPGAQYLEVCRRVAGEWGTSRVCLGCEYDLHRVFLAGRRAGTPWGDRLPAPGRLRAALVEMGLSSTSADAVPEGFDFAWLVNAWAEETRALLGVEAVS